MKKVFFTFAIAACALGASAQSFTVLTKEGEKVSFNNSEVENIRFSTESYVPETPLTPVSFNSVCSDFTPAEGIIDITASPLGLGVFEISFSEKINLNYDCSEKVLLTTGGETVYELGVGDPGFLYYGDFITQKSSVSLKFNQDGFTTPGVYTLSIPAGLFSKNDGTPVAGTARAFIIEDPAPKQTLTITPAPGLVDEVGTVVYRFDNYPVVEMNGQPQASLFIGESTDADSTWPVSLGSDGTVTVEIDPVITAGGIYTLTIPSGAFNLRTEQGGKVYQSQEIRCVYSIESGVAVAAPKVGDFYYSDGSWSTILVDKGDVKPIGVVFYTGIATEFDDNASFYKVKDGSAALSDFHGYVIALRDASYDDDGNNSYVQWGPFSGSTCGCSVNTEDFRGYTNTMTIRSFAGDRYNKDEFAAAWYCTDAFEEKYPAPAQSSGWFMPSAKQLKYIYDNVYFEPNGIDNVPYVAKSLQALAEYGGEEMYVRDASYWTSTEYVDSYGDSTRAYYMDFDSSNIRPGSIAWYNKNYGMRARSVLAF